VRSRQEVRLSRPLAADYPLLDVFWTLAFVALWAVWVWTVIWALMDNFRRSDHGGVAKAIWTLFIIIAPILGMIVYITTRPVGDTYHHARPGDGAAYQPEAPSPAWRR